MARDKKDNNLKIISAKIANTSDEKLIKFLAETAGVNISLEPKEIIDTHNDLFTAIGDTSEYISSSEMGMLQRKLKVY